MRAPVVATVAALLLSACASGYDPLAAGTIADFRPGETNVLQAQRILGRPTSTVRMSDGSFEVTWPPRTGVTTVNREVVKMRFDALGKLMEINRLPVD